MEADLFPSRLGERSSVALPDRRFQFRPKGTIARDFSNGVLGGEGGLSLVPAKRTV